MDSNGWVGAPTDLPGFGDVQWEGAGAGWGRDQVGGDWSEYGQAPSAGGENTAFERITTGIGLGEPVPGPAGKHITTWKDLFDFQGNPTFWMLAFALAAVGFIHLRLEVGGSAGRLKAGGGVHV